MGTITTTKHSMDDDLNYGSVKIWLAGDGPTINDRLYVTTEFQFDLSTGGVSGSSKTHRLADHPALTTAEKLSIKALAAKIFNYDVDHDPMA